MRSRAECGFDERPLTNAEWDQLLELFRRGSKGWNGASAFRKFGLSVTDNADTRSEFYPYSICGIQQAMNIKLGAIGWPFKVVYRTDGYIKDDSHRARMFLPINPRIVLLCKKQGTITGPQVDA